MFQRLVRSLFTWPDACGWLRCALTGLLTLIIIAVIAASVGMLSWRPQLTGSVLRLGKVMLVPALGEELLFRGLLCPMRGDSSHPVRWLTASVVLFTAWHVAEAMTFLPGAHIFLTAPFLACAAVLGMACAWMRYDTGSLWPAVFLHGLLVWTWQTGFGGPDVAQLLR